MSVKKIVVVLAGLFIVTLACATQVNDKAKELILKTTKNSVNITKEFTSINNLQGFVIASKENAGKSTVLYADHDGKYMVAGAVFDDKGENIAAQDYQRYIASEQQKPTDTKSVKTKKIH